MRNSVLCMTISNNVIFSTDMTTFKLQVCKKIMVVFDLDSKAQRQSVS